MVAHERCDVDPSIWTFEVGGLGSSSLASTSSWASTVPKVCAISATNDAVYTHQKKLGGGYDAKCTELNVISKHTNDWMFSADQVAHGNAHRNALWYAHEAAWPLLSQTLPNEKLAAIQAAKIAHWHRRQAEYDPHHKWYKLKGM